MIKGLPPIIRIGTTGDYKPFSFYNQDTNEFVGFDIKLIKQLACKLNINIKFIKTSWPKLENDLESGLFDIAIGGISLTEDRQKKFLVSSPIMLDGKIPLICRKYQHQFKKLSDIDTPNTTIIVNPGGTNEVFVREHIKTAKIIICDDNESIFLKLANEMVDVMITDRIEALYREKLDSRLYAVDPSNTLTKVNYGYIYAKHNDMLKNIIDTELNNIMSTPYFKELFDDFFNFKNKN